MKNVSFTVYSFEELSSEAQATAIEECREYNVYPGWWLNCYEDIIHAGKLIGIEISDPKDISFGFGDEAASFPGRYVFREDAIAQVKKEYPGDSKLNRIAYALAQEQSLWGLDRISANIYANSDNSIRVELDKGDRDVSAIAFLLNEFKRWSYKVLENDFNYRRSDEAVKETLIDGEMLFYASGKVYVEQN